MQNPLLALAKADRLLEKAHALQGRGRFHSASRAYLQAMRTFGRLGARAETREARLGASACLRVLSRYPQARRLWAGYRLAHHDSLLEFGLVERGLGRFTAARRLLTDAVAGARRAGDPGAERHAWWALGGTERFSGRFRQALAAFAKAEKGARALKDRSAWAYALCGQGGMRRVLGDGKTSLRKYRAAHALFVKEGDRFGRAYGLCGMANAERAFGDARRTLPLYRKSAGLYRRLGDTSSEGFAHWGLGGSLRRLRRWPESAAAYARAMKLFQTSGDERGVVMAHVGGAWLAKDQGADHRPAARRALKAARGLSYETALARWMLTADPKPLARFGITPLTISHWQDVP